MNRKAREKLQEVCIEVKTLPDPSETNKSGRKCAIQYPIGEIQEQPTGQ